MTIVTFIWVAIGWFVFSIIDVVWQGLELLVYGKTSPSIPDTIMGFALTVAILIILSDYIGFK